MSLHRKFRSVHEHAASFRPRTARVTRPKVWASTPPRKWWVCSRSPRHARPRTVLTPIRLPDHRSRRGWPVQRAPGQLTANVFVTRIRQALTGLLAVLRTKPELRPAIPGAPAQG